MKTTVIREVFRGEDRVPLLAYTNDVVASHLYAEKQFYEHEMLEVICSRKRHGIYVDVGANIGNHAVFFSRYCLSSLVIALEPHSQNFQVLSSNLSKFSKTKSLPIQCAAGSKQSTCSPVVNSEENMGSVTIKLGGEVPVVTVDDVVLKHGNSDKVAVLKVDVEGMEKDVLLGSTGALHNHKPLVAVEIWTKPQKADIDAILLPLGYKETGVYGLAPTYLYE